MMDIRSAAITPRTMPAFEPELRPWFADTGLEAEGATDGRDEVAVCGSGFDSLSRVGSRYTYCRYMH